MLTDLPVIQAPMAGSQGSALAIAVSNAGGLGSLPCALLTPDAIRGELSAITSATAKPYNVNFFVHREPRVDEARESAWRAVLAPYYRELGLNHGDISPGAGRTRFDDDVAAVVEAFRPPVVSFHFGLPEAALVRRVKAWGAKVIASATTVDEARHLEADGVDAIIAQGVEAGGHRGMFLSDDISTQIGTLPLVRQLVLAVRLPVIAAGGIADAAGVRAALALGATAVQVGTAYLTCPEAKTSAVHRAALKSQGSAVTALTNLFTGRPARGVVNRLMREIGPMNPAAPAFPLASGAIAPLRAKAEAKGSGDFTGLWAGQHVRRGPDLPAAQLTRELAAVD
jgi:nitronate monooxygenase